MTAQGAAVPDVASTVALLARHGLAVTPEDLARMERFRAESEEQAALVHSVVAARYVEPGLVWSARPASAAPFPAAPPEAGPAPLAEGAVA